MKSWRLLKRLNNCLQKQKTAENGGFLAFRLPENQLQQFFQLINHA
ncbi:MAG: hypothetical protein J6W29_05110 [Neisseriaceae bacterium]|nr:hypothetical protein [Neisseriaceae bacterium]